MAFEVEILKILDISFVLFFIIAVVDNFNGKLTILCATVFLKMGSVTAIGNENNDKKPSTKVTI